jgi:hypothetical protein
VRSVLKVSDEVLNKGLTVLAIENTLLEIGKPAYDYVVDMMNKEYHCGLTDCYEHPEYLSEALKKLFGSSHVDIVNSIKKQLEEFSNKKPIGRFVKTLSR